MGINVTHLFNGIGDGRSEPDYKALATELQRLKKISNGFGYSDSERDAALSDAGKIAVGLFNRALVLDGGDPNTY